MLQTTPMFPNAVVYHEIKLQAVQGVMAEVVEAVRAQGPLVTVSDEEYRVFVGDKHKDLVFVAQRHPMGGSMRVDIHKDVHISAIDSAKI